MERDRDGERVIPFLYLLIKLFDEPCPGLSEVQLGHSTLTDDCTEDLLPRS